jgi:hypothetical protein
METQTQTGAIALNSIQSLDKSTGVDSRYQIVPSEHPNCIFKVLGLSPETLVEMYPDRNYGGWRGYTNGDFQIHVSPYHVNANKKISVFTSPDSQPLARRIEERYSNRIHILLDGVKININFNSKDCKKEIVKVGNSHYVKSFNTNFPVSWWFYNGSYEIEQNLRRIPCELTPEMYESLLNEFTSKEAIIEGLNIDKKAGITKTYSQIQDFLTGEKSLTSLSAMKYLLNNAKRTVDNVKISKYINTAFGKIQTQEEFSQKSSELGKILIETKYLYSDGTNFISKILDGESVARDIKKETLKKKSTGAFNKIMDDLEFVKVDKEKHPLTHEAVHSGTIPLGTFFRKSGDNYFVYNDNWDLWEEMMEKFPKEAAEIASTCSGRTTYEKDIMSYFYFVLHRLPQYLKEHTGEEWTCSPRVVNSQNELDPPKAGSGGTAKTRSALTPIVDNETKNVVVPYVSMRIYGGYGTTYCYGLDYNVLDTGLSWKGNVVTKSVEKELNGRDDYGLMFYTLTGTSQGRGYPTFLIIFERLEKGARVHFHRTHPMRSKGGDYNPIHNWTVGCYKWMIGNVNFERIKAQQGDLAFVEIENFPEGEIEKVNAYDGHKFDDYVEYTPYTKKDSQNILGYVNLKKDTVLAHEEHMNRVIPKGVYEIRQCRSWEANPTGIWSLRID